MRLALVTRPAAGGIRRHIHLLVQGIQQWGWEPLLYAPDDFLWEGAPLQRHGVPFGPEWNPAMPLRTVLHLTKQLRAHAPDLVHAHGLRAALITAFAAKRAQCPFLFTLHNLLPPLSPPQRLLLKWAAHRAIHILAVSKAVALSAAANGLPTDAIEVVPNGIHPEPFLLLPSRNEARSLLHLPPEPPIVAAVGRLAPEKGFDILVATAERLGDMPQPPLVALAGEGPCKEALQRQIATLPPHAAPVRLMGPLAHIGPLLAAADLVAIPSRAEGQGLVAIEAMFARKTIVATAVGGLPETLGGGSCAVLVPPENPAAFAEAIRALLCDPAQREHFAEAAFQRAFTLYTAEKMLARHKALYLCALPKKFFC